MSWPPAVLPAGWRGRSRPAMLAAVVVMTAACTAHAGQHSPTTAGATSTAPSTAPRSDSSKPAAPTPLTVTQVSTLAQRDVRLLVDVDYRQVNRDFAAAEAQLTPEFTVAFIAAARTGGPDVRGYRQTEANLIKQHIVETIQAFTSVTTETSDPAYPTATLQFTVRHNDSSSDRAVSFPARVRLTFANPSGRWLVANEEIFPVHS